MIDNRKQETVDVFDRAAETYDQLGVDFFTPMDRGSSPESAPPRRAGAGPRGWGGAVTFAAAEAVGDDGEVFAIDLAPTMVKLLRAGAHDRGLGSVHAAVGDADAPDFAPEFFGVLLGGW